MLLPLGTDRPLRRPTRVNHALLGVSVLAFAALQLLQSRRPGLFEEALAALWLDPHAVKPWAFLSYQFVHADALHLLGNMLFLWVFGPNVEDRLGRLGYLAFYLVGGAAAGAAHLLFSDAPVVGASGAIAAVTGAYFVLFPRTRIRTLVFFFIIGVFQIPAMWFIGFAVAKDVFFSAFGGENVAYAAHLGGYLYGGFVAYALLATNLLEREVWDLFSVRRQARRRRLFRQVMQRQGAGVWEGAAAQAPPAMQRDGDSGAASSRTAQRALERRRRVREALARDDLDAALAAARELHSDGAPLALGRDALLRLARAAYEQDEHDLASALCRAFLESRRDDSEAGRMALMLALSQLKVGAVAGAQQALARARRHRLTEEERELAGALERELAAAS